MKTTLWNAFTPFQRPRIPRNLDFHIRGVPIIILIVSLHSGRMPALFFPYMRDSSRILRNPSVTQSPSTCSFYCKNKLWYCERIFFHFFPASKSTQYKKYHAPFYSSYRHHSQILLEVCYRQSKLHFNVYSLCQKHSQYWLITWISYSNWNAARKKNQLSTYNGHPIPVLFTQ